MTISIAIIGAGFSGISTLAQLLSTNIQHQLSIVIIDSIQHFGRGIAYQRNDLKWMMNAPAGILSAYPDTPADFIDYCYRKKIPVNVDDYVPRELYGSYLQEIYRKLVTTSTKHQVRAIHKLVKDIKIVETSSIAIALDGEKELLVDYVILASGTSKKKPILAFNAHALGSRYIVNPLEELQTKSFPSGSKAMILGSGLTAMDVSSALYEKFGMQSVLLSRRGLLPFAHQSFEKLLGNIQTFSLKERLMSNPRQCVAVLREVIAHHTTVGGNWREVIDAIRPWIPAIWSAWSTSKKKAFIRHLAPYWNVHRHRSTPIHAEAFVTLMKNSKVTLEAGRITGVSVRKESLEIIVRRRTKSSQTYHTDFIFNCTNSSTNHFDELLEKLRLRGLISKDTLGFKVDPSYRIVTADGSSNDNFMYIGPCLESLFFEATAVPELRWHATQLVSFLRKSINRRSL